MLDARFRNTTMLHIAVLFRKMDMALSLVPVFLFVAIEPKDDETYDCTYEGEQLQYRGHARLLSTSMPASSNPMPITIMDTTIYQLDLLRSTVRVGE